MLFHGADDARYNDVDVDHGSHLLFAVSVLYEFCVNSTCKDACLRILEVFVL